MSQIVASFRSRTDISPTVSEDEENDGEWLSWLMGVLEHDENPEEEFDKSGTSMGTICCR